MTVRELIAALEWANPDATVLFEDNEGYYSPSEVWTDEQGDVRVA